MTGGWFKVPRVDRDVIIAKLGSERAPSAIVVWLALRDIANERRSDAIQCSAMEISRVAGTSRRTVERVLPMLRDIGLVRWDQSRLPETKGLGASIYHVLSLEPPATMAEPPADKAEPPAKDSENVGGVYNSKTGKTGNTLQPASQSAGELPLQIKSDQKPKAKASRPTDPLFDALVRIECPNPRELNDRVSGKVVKALQLIRQSTPDVTVEEIERRAAIYPLLMPLGRGITALGLASNWPRCATPPAPQVNGRAPWQRIKDIEEQLKRHPGNPESLEYNGDTVTQGQTQDFRAKRAELEQMRKATQ